MADLAWTTPAFVAEHGAKDLRTVLVELRSRCNELAFAMFGAGRPADTAVVLLCGWGERFAPASLLRDAAVPALVVQDPVAPWYTGSEVCSGLDGIEAAIRTHLGQARRLVCVGQSSGGHAALVLSQRFHGSVAIAVSPQTFADREAKSRIAFPEHFFVDATPDAIVDVLDARRAADEAGIAARGYVIAPVSERANPPQTLFWCDYLHWVRLAHLERLHVLLLERETHALIKGHAAAFSRFLGAVLAEPDGLEPEGFTRLARAHLYGPAPPRPRPPSPAISWARRTFRRVARRLGVPPPPVEP
jgi:hypothetical protein